MNDLASSDPEALYAEGVRLDEQGQSQSALACYSKAIDLRPDYHEAWARRGMTLMLMGKLQLAIGNFNQAVALEQAFDLAWYLKAYCHAQLGAEEIALLALRKAITLNPSQWIPMAKQEPAFATMSGDGRFQSMVEGIVEGGGA
jgi:tetratricopeptide (TPR) repeat protein